MAGNRPPGYYNRDNVLRARLRQGPARPLRGKLLRMVHRHRNLEASRGADWIRDWQPTRPWRFLRRQLHGNRQ